MITPSALAIILQGAPFPGAVLTVTPGGAALDLTIDGATITFCEGTWFAAERRTSPAHLSFAAAPTAEQVHTEIRRVLAIVKAPAVELTPKTTKIARMAPGHLDGVLLHKPLPGAGDLRLTTEGLHFTVGDITLRYDGEAFHAPRYRVESTLPHPAAINAQGVHAEIHRVLAIVMGAGDRAADLERRLAAIKSDRHEETLRWADEREALRADLAKITDAHAVVSQRLAGSQKEVTERDATIESNEAKVIDLTLRLGETQNRVADLESELAGVRAAKRSVEGDCAISAKRAAEAERARKADADLLVMRTNDLAAERARAEAAEAKVKRLLRQRNAAHDVLDEAGIGLEVEGSPRWTLARRIGHAVAEIRDHLDAVNALDAIAKVVGLIPPSLSSGATDDEVVAKVKALHQEGADLTRLRAPIAIGLGLDESASLSLILDAVNDDRDDPDTQDALADSQAARGLRALVSYHQAPITFNARPLTLAERAAFVIRRLWQGRTNAANEAAALRRELGDIADALGDLPDTAEREPIGDRKEHLGLSTAERIRLSR